MDRRECLRPSGGAAILGIGYTTERRQVWVQETISQAELGLPELTVTLTEADFQVSPSEVAAGWATVTFANKLAEGDDGSDLMPIPAGQPSDDVVKAAAMPSTDTEFGCRLRGWYDH